MSIKVIRFLNNETIIGEITKKEDGVMTVINAMAIVGQQDGEQLKLGFNNWMVFVSPEEEHSVPLSSVQVLVDPPENMLNSYKQMFGKIIVAQGSLAL